MSRFIAGVIALAVLSIVPIGQAKPPDLPENLIITVQPIQYIPVEFIPAPTPPDQHALRQCPVVCPTVLENLKRLVEAGEELESARKHAEAGNLAAALERIDAIRKLVPGTSIEKDCEAVVLQLSAKWNIKLDGMGECCCGCPYYAKFVSTARCWMSQAHTWAKKVDWTAAQDGKAVMVEGLLKAAHLALGEGRMDKAAELVRQAYALNPKRVEADPLAYKMGLLEGRTGGGEEASEPLPAHPRQLPKMTQKVSLKVSAHSQVKNVIEYLASVQFRLDSPPKHANGIMMFGLMANGRPSLMMHARCPTTGATWHICLGGMVPVVWVTTN